jgi:NitT/TauT family transport system ATP-binding protein
VGYITQQDNLLPWRTLEDNVAIALEIAGVSRAERKRRVAETIELVGLVGFEKHYPSQLSGGMRKRATLARTLIYSPDTLLMDEPFGALDAMLKNTLQLELLRLWDRDRKTVLFVTHDLDEAILLADEIVVFGTNPGRVIHVEKVNLPRPRNLSEIRGSSHFTEVWERLWALIESNRAFE